MNLRTDRPEDGRCDAPCCGRAFEIRYTRGATEANREADVRLCDPHYRAWLDELESARAGVARESEKLVDSPEGLG